MENQPSEGPSASKSNDTASDVENQISGDTPTSRFADTASAAKDQPSEDPSASIYTWTINKFSSLNSEKHYSDIFTIGGHKWRLLIFPKGNNVEQLSVYLDVADAATLPYGWSRQTKFSLAVINHFNSKFSIRKDVRLHEFHAEASDWGFTSFIPLEEIYDPSKGFLVNDTLIIEANVAA